MEQNARFLSEGEKWNPRLSTDQFYEGYLRRIFGEAALPDMLQACKILEKNAKAIDWTAGGN